MAQITLSYLLYDTVIFGATANAESILFQTTSGADANHGEQVTNMRGAGVLPATEDFVVYKISVAVDKQLAKADLVPLFNGSIIEVRLADFSIIKGPTVMFVNASAFGGALIEAAAADTIAAGLLGDGYELKKPIHIPGATPFKVRVLQGPAVTAGTNIKVILEGDYTLAGQGF